MKTRDELIETAVQLEKDIRLLEDFAYEDTQAAQGAAQCADSLAQARTRLALADAPKN